MADRKVGQTGDTQPSRQFCNQLVNRRGVRVLVIRHVSELTHGQTDAPGQGARLLQLPQQSINPVRRLVDVLQDYDGAVTDHRIRCAAHRREHGQIPARQSPGHHTVSHRHRSRPHTARLAHAAHCHLQGLRTHRWQHSTRRVRVETHNACACRDRTMQRGDIRKSKHRLRRASECIERYIPNDPRHSVATANTPHHVDLRIVQRPLQITQSRRIGSSQIPGPRQHRRTTNRHPAKRSHMRLSTRNILLASQRTRR